MENKKKKTTENKTKLPDATTNTKKKNFRVGACLYSYTSSWEIIWLIVSIIATVSSGWSDCK